MLGCLTSSRRELLCDKPDLLAELVILLLQSGDDLIAVDDAFEFGLVFGRPLQYFFDSRTVFALQFANKVEALFDLAQAARIVFDIAFVFLHLLQGFAGVAPLCDFRGELRAQGQEFCIAIKEVDVLFGTQQAHMLALTMDIDQPAGYLLEYLLRVGPAIDAGYGTPGTEDIA